MKTVTIKYNKTIISTISTTNLRNNFPSVYRAIFKRIGTGSTIFTREMRTRTGETFSEPYIILTKSNKIFEIKECGSHFYLDLIGDEKVGQVFRTEYERARYEVKDRRKKIKRDVFPIKITQAA